MTSQQIEDLDKLAAMHEKGILSHEEFESAKARIMQQATPPVTDNSASVNVPTPQVPGSKSPIGGIIAGVALFGFLVWLALKAMLGSGSTQDSSLVDTTGTASSTVEAEVTPLRDIVPPQDLAALKPSMRTEIEGIKLTFDNVTTAKTWTVDRYDDSWHYHTAERGNHYLKADVRVYSESKAPVLPPIHVYAYQDSSIIHVATLRYQFYRWQGHGQYIGLYHDTGNDFAHSSTVRMTAGAEIPTELLVKTPLLVVVEEKECFLREGDQIGTPDIAYKSICSEAPKTLSLEDLKGSFRVVKIFNTIFLNGK